jgi:hypothetical protein
MFIPMGQAAETQVTPAAAVKTCPYCAWVLAGAVVLAAWWFGRKGE